MNPFFNTTIEQNRAFITTCAKHGRCSMPDYIRQDAEIEIIRREKRTSGECKHFHKWNYLNVCERCGKEKE